MTIAWSPTCLNAAYDPRANPAFTGMPFTVTLRSVRGMPMRKTSPGCICPDLPRACSTAFQSGSAARAAAGTAAATRTPNPMTAYLICRSVITIAPSSRVRLMKAHHIRPVDVFHGRVGREIQASELRRDGVEALHGAVVAVPLVQLFGHRLELMALDHRLALRLGGRQVVAARDRLRLRDLPRRVVDNNLRKSRPLLRVDRQLQPAVLHLILRRNWRPGCCTGRESGLQRDLRRAERFGEFGVLFGLILLGPCRLSIQQPHRGDRQRDASLHDHVLLHLGWCSSPDLSLRRAHGTRCHIDGKEFAGTR